MIHLDERLFLWVNGLAGRWPTADSVVRLLVNDYFIMLLISFLLFAMWFAGRTPARRARLQLAVLEAATAIAVAGGVVKLLYFFLDRPRPFDYLEARLLFYEPVDPSFPAKPAAVAFAAAICILLGSRQAGLIALALATLFGVARVYAGVHFPGDIIGGALLGIACGYLARWLLAVLRPLPDAIISIVRRLGLA